MVFSHIELGHKAMWPHNIYFAVKISIVKSLYNLFFLLFSQSIFMSQNSLKIKNKIILKKPPVRVRSKKMHKIAKAMFPLSKASLVSVLDEFSVSID